MVTPNIFQCLQLILFWTSSSADLYPRLSRTWLAPMSDGAQLGECKTHQLMISIQQITDFLHDEDLTALVPTCITLCDRLDKCRYEVEDHWIFSSFQKPWTLSVIKEMEERYSIVEKRPKWQKFHHGIKVARMKRALRFPS